MSQQEETCLEAGCDGYISKGIQLIVGVKDSLRVVKIKGKKGEKGSADSLAVKGGFSLEKETSEKPSLDIILDGRSVVVPAGDFSYNKKGTIVSCKKVKTAIGLVNAKLDIAKCSFSISVRNTELGILEGFEVFLNYHLLPGDAPENRIVINTTAPCGCFYSEKPHF